MTIYEMQIVCNNVLSTENKPAVLVKLGRKNARRSRACPRPSGNYIAIAPFIFAYPEEVQRAEIIHESCHFLPDNPCRCVLNHGKLFRQKEISWLAQYGLKPLKYVGVYNRLLETAAGEVIPTRGIDNKRIEYWSLEMKAKNMSKRTKHERITL